MVYFKGDDPHACGVVDDPLFDIMRVHLGACGRPPVVVDSHPNVEFECLAQMIHHDGRAGGPVEVQWCLSFRKEPAAQPKVRKTAFTLSKPTPTCVSRCSAPRPASKTSV